MHTVEGSVGPSEERQGLGRNQPEPKWYRRCQPFLNYAPLLASDDDSRHEGLWAEAMPRIPSMSIDQAILVAKGPNRCADGRRPG
jgi:diadenosine tetraphosphatase ApaH/serine/threonine PP2A family protein phosphatase